MSVTLSFNPAGPQYRISEQSQMPDITATATIANLTLDPKTPPQYQWVVTLIFDGKGCPNFAGSGTTHPEIKQTTTANTFKIPFTAVRGGDLLVSLTVTVGTTILTAKSENLKVIGTNPSASTLGHFVDSLSAPVSFRKLMRVESGLQQFITRSAEVWPLYSNDHLGGVGICQVTTPPPTPDQVWIWKDNVKAGWVLYQDKQRSANAYPAHVRKSPAFQALVKAYNDQRYEKQKQAALAAPAAGPKAEVPRKDLVISLPDYTAVQLERDTVRAFNGFAAGMHEFRVRVDTNGLLVVTEDEPNQKGAAEWEQISAAERIKEYDRVGIPANRRGDPNYVNDVEAKASF